MKEFTEEQKYLRAKKQVDKLKGFYANVASYCIVIPFLIFIANSFPAFSGTQSGLYYLFSFISIDNYFISKYNVAIDRSMLMNAV